MEARKATPEPRADLALYAMAQVRAFDVLKELRERCDGCPGPEDMEHGCATRAVKQGLFRRTDWPMCQRGMLLTPSWADFADLYRASLISPIADFPDGLTAVAFDALLELKLAVQDDFERRRKESEAKGGAGSSTELSGRRGRRA